MLTLTPKPVTRDHKHILPHSKGPVCRIKKELLSETDCNVPIYVFVSLQSPESKSCVDFLTLE